MSDEVTQSYTEYKCIACLNEGWIVHVRSTLPNGKERHAVECKICGRTSVWKDSLKEALDAFYSTGPDVHYGNADTKLVKTDLLKLAGIGDEHDLRNRENE